MSDELSLDPTVSPESKSVIGEELPTPSSSQRSFRPKWGLILLGGLVAFVGLSLAIPRLRNSNPSQPAVRVLSVKTTQLKAVKSYPVNRTYTGEVVATRTSELGFERSGKLIWLNVDQGDQIAAGTAIAKLDTQNLVAQREQLLAQKAQAMAVLQELLNGPRTEVIAAQRASVGDLQDQLALERLKRDRRRYLYEEGAISQEQLDEAAFSQAALSERLAAAQSKLNELRAGTRSEQVAAQRAIVKQTEANLADLEITIAKSTLTAPYAGIIGERRLDEGTIVNAGQAVVRLVEASSPEVEVGVPANAVSRLQSGTRHKITIGEATYQATVTSIKPETNPTTRTRTVVLQLNASAQGTVAPKQIARLSVTQTVATEGYWLPTTALIQSERGLWSCYALAEAEQPSSQEKTYRVEQREVEVLYTEGDRALVRGTLQPNDIMIETGIQRIVPGQLVQK